MRNDVNTVNRRREVAVEGIRTHLKTNEKDNKKWDGLTPEQKAAHTEKHKAQLKVLEERVRVKARARRYLDRQPNTGLQSPRASGTVDNVSGMIQPERTVEDLGVSDEE